MGGHAGAEAVDSNAFFLFGLVGTFHNIILKSEILKFANRIRNFFDNLSIIAGGVGFVTEGYICSLFSNVEKMGIIEKKLEANN